MDKNFVPRPQTARTKTYIIHNKLNGRKLPGKESLMKRMLMFFLLLALCAAFIACGVDAPNAPKKDTVTAHDDPPVQPPLPTGGSGGG
jgi:hypothetical protein